MRYNHLMKTVIKPPVAILGFGIEGQSALAFLNKQGITDITICDENNMVHPPAHIKSRIGPGALENLTEFQTIIRSPGIHYKRPGLQEARDAACIVTSMTELTLENAAQRLTAITGSNGKTTTTGMIAAILQAHYGSQLIVGGNDRQPVLSEVLAKQGPVLLEVSSFQFADLKQSPHISVILNITPNHLDWHENEADYLNAKSNLIAHQTKSDWAILNAHNQNSAKLSQNAPGRIFWLNKKEGEAWVVWKEEKLMAKFGSEEKVILNKNDLFVKTHPDNLLAAVAVSLIHKVNPDTIKKNPDQL